MCCFNDFEVMEDLRSDKVKQQQQEQQEQQRQQEQQKFSDLSDDWDVFQVSENIQRPNLEERNEKDNQRAEEARKYLDAMEQKEEARREYQKNVVNLDNVAQLGHKQTVMFKSDREVRKRKNARIDKAKILTRRATAETLSVYETIKAVKESLKDREYNADTAAQVFNELNIAMGQLDVKSFEGAEIRENYAAYYKIIQNFEYLENYGSQAGAEDGTVLANKADLERFKPVIEQLRYRLQVYSEQNRVRLDGSVLGEKEEGTKLQKKHVESWKNSIAVLHDYINVQEGAVLTDEERLELRERKAEVARPDAKMKHGIARLTREQSMTTESDVKSQKKRDELRDLNYELYNLGIKDVAETVQRYVNGSRYAVGYTEERERLKAAMKAVKKKLDKADISPEAREALTKVRNYFDGMTNGTLEIPADAEILDCTHDSKLEEEGHGRNWVTAKTVNGMTRWSDQRNAPLFSHEPVVNDLKQRLVSNCYMMASTAGVINVSPELLKNCLKDNGDGTVTVRLYEKTITETDEMIENVMGLQEKKMVTSYRPVFIRVKKTVPRTKVGSADALSAGSLWMQMIEKACAFYGRREMEGVDGGAKEKVIGKGYRSLWYGSGAKFLERLLGVDGGKQVSLSNNKQKEAFFAELCDIQNSKKVYSTGSDEGAGAGLDTGHAYTIMGGVVIQNQRYVRMRNPYSNHALQYHKKGKKSKDGGLTPFSNGSDETYGQFLMKYEDFCQEFPNVYASELKGKVDAL